jgi:DedD protein
MADPNIREIQVSAKQLVFLFMASVVLAVAVFLLGVSVGRGVRDKTGAAPATEASAGAVAAPTGPLPPATELPPNTLKYPELSKADGSGVGSSTKAEPAPALPPPTDVPDVSEPDGPPAAKEPKAAVAPPPPAPKPEPAPKTPAKTPELPAQPKPGSGWSAQIGAFRSRENADKQAAALKAKGYPATVSAPIGGLFRVRVGPYTDRAEADRVAAKLKQQEGFTPSVSR